MIIDPKPLWQKHRSKARKFCGVNRRIYIQYINEVPDETIISSCFYDTIFCYKSLFTEKNLKKVAKRNPEINTPEKQIVFLLAHEMQHAKQFEDGVVYPFISRSGNVLVKWHGKTFRKVMDYDDYPWETDANTMALAYVRSFFK